MRVVHLSTEDAGSGAFVAAERLVHAQRTHGIEASLLVGTQHMPSDESSAAQLGSLGALHQWLRKASEAVSLWGTLAKWRRDRFLFSAARYGSPVWRQPLIRDADVINLHWTNHGFVSLEGLKRIAELQKPVIWTLHDYWTLTGGCLYPKTCTHYLQHCGHCPMLARPASTDLSAQLWQRKHALYRTLKPNLVAVSQWLATETRRAPLTSEYGVRVIANPIDVTQFSPRDRKQARVNCGIPSDGLVVLFVSRRLDDVRKGLPDLIAALQKIVTSVVLVTVGEGALSEDELGHVNHIGLGPITRSSQMSNIYAAADVFAVPSIEDNLPTTVMEAMASGLPVVGYRTGGIPEMVSEGSSGLLVPTGEVTALSTALNQLLDSASLRERMGSKGRSQSIERYSESAVAAKYAELYQQLIASR